MKFYDVVVIGVGSMGSAACYWLSKRGYHVLGLEQFDIPHEKGSHTGQSRIIRKAYFEHPDYVPLLQRAYENWLQLENRSSTKVYYKTGILYHGPASHAMINGVREAALKNNIELDNLDRQKKESKFPQFAISQNFESLYEPDAGFIRPERAITLYKDEALKAGAEIRTHEKVLELKKENNEIKVITEKGTYHARKLIITAGAWAIKMIPQLKKDLKISRQLLVWVKPKDIKNFLPNHFPCWIIADDKRKGALYGFPYLAKNEFGEPEGLKFAWHHPGEETNPDQVNRNISEDEIQKLIQQISAYIPAVADADIVAAKTCLYTNTEDENFIIDHLPGYNKDVTIATGFSGHGFKFVSVVGEILADLAINGKTDLPVEFLSLKRFQKN